MGSLIVALPIICCLLIPAVIGLGVFFFRRPQKQISDLEGQIDGVDQPVGRDARNREELT